MGHDLPARVIHVHGPPPGPGGHTFDALRARLARAEALPQLATLGVICGLLTGIVIIAFRLLIEASQSLFLPGAEAVYVSDDAPRAPSTSTAC